MTLQSDGSVGAVAEPTYGTAVVVTRFPEYLTADFKQENEYLQGEGLRVGKLLPRSSRKTLGKVVAGGELELELATKGLGIFWNAALGTGTSTLRSGVIYQQLYTMATTDPMPGLTIQTGVPPIGGGTTIAQTFLGCVCKEWELSVESAGKAMFKSSWDAKEMKTDVAYAAPSYVATPKIFAFPHLSVSIGVNGTSALTVPTTTAIGSTAASASANVTAFSIKVENGVDEGGFVAGAAGKRGRRPVYGKRSVTGSLTIEFTSVVERDYYLNQSSLHLVATLTSDDLVEGSTYAAWQAVVPELRFEGAVPVSNNGETITVEVPFTALDGESATHALYVVAVTADSAP